MTPAETAALAGPARLRTGTGAVGRVLMLTSSFPRWEGDSTAPFLLHLAQDLQAVGWHVDVLAPHAPGAAKAEVLAGVQVERFRYQWPEALETVCYGGGALINLRHNPINWLKVPVFAACQWFALLHRLAGRRYDVLHSHWLLPQGLVGSLTARPLGIPHLVTVHGSDIFALRSAVFRSIKRLALSRADALTVNSSATLAEVHQLSRGFREIHKIPMGVSTDAQPQPARAQALRRRYRRGAGPLLIFVGRLVREKGVGDLIRAVALLINRSPDATAVLVGDGQDRNAMERLAAELGVRDRVTFAGSIEPDDVPNYLAAADVSVVPSWFEAQGLASVEAMMAGTPVVATRVGGIPDAVRHEETGLLVPPNDPEAIVAAVRRLAEDVEFAERLTQAAQRHARANFTRSASAVAFSDLLRGLMSARVSLPKSAD